MKKLSYLSLLLFLLGAFTALAQNGNGTVTEKVDLSMGVWNPCCDEPVLFTGTGHFSFKFTDNGDGTYTLQRHWNWSGAKGTGLETGLSYNLMDNGKLTETWSDPLNDDFTVTDRLKVVAKGKGGVDCSGTLIVKIHFVMVDGVPVVNDYTYEWECKSGTIS